MWAVSVEGYEPKTRSLLGPFFHFLMARSHSVPSRGLGGGDWAGNPFYSKKAQDEYRLASSRPDDLPAHLDDSFSREPIRNVASGLAVPPSFHMDPTGKGRGSSSAGLLDAEAVRPTVAQGNPMKTEGKMPSSQDAGTSSMGPVGGTPMGRMAKIFRER